MLLAVGADIDDLAIFNLGIDLGNHHGKDEFFRLPDGKTIIIFNGNTIDIGKLRFFIGDGCFQIFSRVRFFADFISDSKAVFFFDKIS